MASDVIGEALRLLEEHDRLTELRRDVSLGFEQLNQGQHRPFDDEALERIKRGGRERATVERRNQRR